jgi:hypothetical protein
MKIANHRDLALGILVLAFASFGLWHSRDLPVGTAAEMQAAYFPRLIFWLLLGLGALCLMQSIRSRAIGAADQPQPEWIRATVGITTAVITFALTVRLLGLIPASALLCLISGFSSSGSRFREVVLLSAGLALASAVIFVLALGLPIPMWPQ